MGRYLLFHQIILLQAKNDIQKLQFFSYVKK